jgi:fimbrial chaperone protein
MRTTRHRNRTTAAASWPSCLLWVVFAVGLTLCQAVAARAASFSVNPTQLMLSGGAKSALVSLKNETDQPVRFQLSVMAWNQAVDGQMQLSPTEDVVFFPALLTLKGHEERKVRVGATVAPGSVEKTYRLFIEELPPLENAEGTTGVAMVTKMGIPIFLRPAKVTAQAALEDLNVKSGRLCFRLQNKGNVYFIPQVIHVRGLDASGTTVVDQQPSGWYVLAGGARAFEVDIPAAQCGQVRSFLVEAQLSGTRLTETLQTPAGACAK